MKPSLYAPSAGDLFTHAHSAHAINTDMYRMLLLVDIPGFYGIQLISVPKEQHSNALNLHLLSCSCEHIEVMSHSNSSVITKSLYFTFDQIFWLHDRYEVAFSRGCGSTLVLCVSCVPVSA